MINWTLKIFRDLNKELARLFDTKESAERIVALSGIDKSFVSWQNKPIDNWYNIMDTADKRQQLIALLELINEEFPNNNIIISAMNITEKSDKNLSSN